MIRKLLAIGGPLRQSEFSLATDITIGRDADNTIRLNEASVSPRHCSVGVCEGHVILIDLDSQSGTFVNGIPVKLRELQPADEIAVGNSVFLFQAAGTRDTHSNPVKMREDTPQGLQTLRLPLDELRSLQPQTLAALPPAERAARNLSVLLQISRSISLLRDEESLPWQLLGLIFDTIPAERGAILLLEEDGQQVRSQAAWDRVAGPDHPVDVSGAIVRRVAKEGASLLDTSEGRTLLCVPMTSKEKTVGVIYLESSDTAAPLTKEDFPLLAAIAGLGVVGIENARQFARLDSENQRLLAEVSLTHDMVGRSTPMRAVYKFIERVAPSDSTVLISGESGTGKELAALAIHKNSPRKNQPFIALNCAALTETLLESELFGHEKGAFTSAISLKKGFLEVAEGGTIFLDEIGELSPILQAKLLRVLEEREFVRVGGTRSIKINIRFVAATNKDLQKEVRDGGFRADLFHRLNVISIKLPSLREHAEDVPALAHHFSILHGKNCDREITGVSSEALKLLAQYDWPGNIRELKNAIERAVVVGSSDTILAEDLPETILESGNDEASVSDKYHDAVRNLKKQLIVSALEQSSGNITEAAKQLGVHPNYLHRLMRNLELRPALKKQTSA
ncbi:MAG TPA: sigma 54-interacting transcriptional regulator [Candidatus Dormibacteraeota bacterium]|nr:sigma 54-interacting transcriptional regulator [Candidatus Dormibacteraeota bacterium]